MYELCRIRLRSVGPPGARYEDVLLDLSDVGQEVTRQQASLLELSEPVRRPSPATVLFLENGGGKSVLIKLIFSVMLPGRRQVVGTTSTKVLEKFVSQNDISHVILEWMHTETGRRLITGKVSEWRGHALSSDPANLIDSWYCFRPGETLDLDALELTAEDSLGKTRAFSMSAFRDQVHDAAAKDPETELFWTRRHNEWTERLDALGLDTELFRYQRAMNAGEGEAADAFAFSTDEVFVEFLLRAVLSEEEPRDLADVLSTYAENLARRGDLTLERDFVAEALELLTPLAQEESVAAASRKLAEQARSEVESFAGQLVAREQQETEHLTFAQTRFTEASEAERLAEGDQRRRSIVVAELRRLVAKLRLEEAFTEQEAATSELEEAKLVERAWDKTSVVLEHLNSAREASSLRALVGAEEEKARPALEAKNTAATTFARGLLALNENALRDAELAQARVGEGAKQAQRAQEESHRATTVAASAKAKANQLSEQIEQARGEIATAVQEGLLSGRDLSGRDAVTDAAALAEESVLVASTELTETEAEFERLETSQTQAQSTVYAAQQRVSTASARYEEFTENLETAKRKADSLAAEPRLIELLDVVAEDGVNLETDAPALLTLLGEAKAEAERARIELEVAEASDKQARLALDNGELLPPPPEVSEVRAALAAGGVSARLGWEYLAGIPDVATRKEITTRVPQLATGVLLNDSSQSDRAREILVNHSLRPATLVAVGTTAAVLTGQGSSKDLPAGVDFVVPLNPALYDPAAAALEQTAIQQRHSDRQKRLAVLVESLRIDDDLTHRITAWRQEYPPGSVAMVAENKDTSARELAEAGQELTECQVELTRVTTRRTALREKLPELRSALRQREEIARRLKALVLSSERIPEWTDAAKAAEETASREETKAKAAGEQATLLRAEAAEHQRTADAHRRTADSATAELAEVPGGGSASKTDPAPDEPVDALRQSFRAAAEAYAKVEVGSDLQAELRQKESTEAKARVAIEELAPEVRELATRLLESSSGSDASARAAAKQQANRKVVVIGSRVSAAISDVATRRVELEQLPKHSGPVDDFTPPRDIDHGRELIERATEELSIVAREWEEAQRRSAEAKRALENVDSSAAAFRVMTESLTIAVPDGDFHPVYAGDIASARERHTTLNEAWGVARESAATADERVRAVTDEIAQYASDKRFEKLGIPVRRQIMSVKRAELPSYAQKWADALRPRLRTLTDDLAQIDRHRSGIITRLQGMVDSALRTLRSAQRVSRLPEGLGEWSGKDFLRIAFTQLEDDVLAEKLGEVVDETAIGRTRDGRELKRDGMSLLLRGVLAASPKGFRVDMLKPDSVLRTERQRVSEIRDVFSGGQQLTAAIILYCTMAALRANNRGKVKNRHSGVLFLDNPIGRASAGYLLELQRSVASALGVQLIYTTGLFDAGALSEFPLIVRLRNDADLRAGRKYLSVEDIIGGKLPAADGTPQLSATRMFVRESEPSSLSSRALSVESSGDLNSSGERHDSAIASRG